MSDRNDDTPEYDESVIIELPGEGPSAASQFVHPRVFEFKDLDGCLAAIAAANHSYQAGQMPRANAKFVLECVKAATKIHLGKTEAEKQEAFSALRELAKRPPYATSSGPSTEQAPGGSGQLGLRASGGDGGAGEVH